MQSINKVSSFKEVDIEVIGAGWGRTSTSSFQKALEILGYPKCYHMTENFANSQAAEWIRVADNDPTFDIHEILGKRGYSASTDFPSAVYWEKQLERYPNAKVVLTYRDPESWYKSFCETIAQLQPDNDDCLLGVRVAIGMGLPIPNFAAMLNKVITRDCFNNDWSKENILKCYINNIEYIRKTCPPEKFLEFEPSQGWEPLCKFLNKEIPKDIPYPKVNSSNELQRTVSIINMVGYGMSVCGFGVPMLLRQLSLVDKTTMMAAVYESHESTGYDAIEVKRVTKVLPKPGYAIVKVKVAAINPLDFKIFRGYVTRMGWKMKFPFTPGYDFAGVIESIYQKDTVSKATFNIGDEVFGFNFGFERHDDEYDSIGGSIAEYISVPIHKLSLKPSSVSFDIAGSISLAGSTAYQLLHICCKDIINFDDKSANNNCKILILGGSTSVGLMTIQLAQRLGCWVATTCSGRNVEFIQKNCKGVKIINYEEKKWYEDSELLGIDILLDTCGESGAFKNMKDFNIVKSDGVFASICSFDAGMNPLGHPPMKYCAKFGVNQNTNHLNEIIQLIASNDLTLPVDESFEFSSEGIRNLLSKVEKGKSQGKNIVRISS